MIDLQDQGIIENTIQHKESLSTLKCCSKCKLHLDEVMVLSDVQDLGPIFVCGWYACINDTLLFITHYICYKFANLFEWNIKCCPRKCKDRKPEFHYKMHSVRPLVILEGVIGNNKKLWNTFSIMLTKMVPQKLKVEPWSTTCWSRNE